MSKYKPRKPREDIEYTFVFKKKQGGFSRYTLRFLYEDENGMLVFFNVTTKQKAKPMTLRHFDWIYERDLIFYKKVGKAECIAEVKISVRDKRNLRMLKGLELAERRKIEETLPYDVDELQERYIKALKENNGINAFRMICDGISEMIVNN